MPSNKSPKPLTWMSRDS